MAGWLSRGRCIVSFSSLVISGWSSLGTLFCGEGIFTSAMSNHKLSKDIGNCKYI